MLIYFLVSSLLVSSNPRCGKKQDRHHRGSSSTDLSTSHTQAPHLRSIAAFAEITVTRSDHAAGADVPAAAAAAASSPLPPRRRLPARPPKNGTAILPPLAPRHSMDPYIATARYWANAVAPAAPATPIDSVNMNTGSRRMLVNAALSAATAGALVSACPRNTPSLTMISSTAGAASARTCVVKGHGTAEQVARFLVGMYMEYRRGGCRLVG